MPRAPLYSPEEICTALHNWNFMEDGKYLSYNNQIWVAAIKKLPKMTVNYLWLYITQNRHGVSTRIHGTALPKTKTQKNSFISNWSIQNQKQDLTPLIDTIHLSAEEWNGLRLKSKVYKDNREYDVLEPGWTDKIYFTIWNKFKLPCAFAFQTAKINKDSEFFLFIRGTCTECKNEISMRSYSKPTDDGIDIHISTYDTTKLIHKKKRQLRGQTRKIVCQEVKATSTFTWRRNHANELMSFGDREPAHLYSSNVLRTAVHKQKYKDLDLKSFAHPILALLDLKRNPKYSGSIREIAADKMYVMYWLPEQIYLYKLFLKKDAIGSICVDATGSIIKSIPNIDNSKRVIFLYQIITSYNGMSLPLCQFVSEKHDANTLQYWIGEWLRSGIKAPRQIVSDFSLALLNATCLAFNNMRLSDYVDYCFSIISRDNTDFKMNTILRIDISHLIKLVTAWPCFKNKKINKKEFYVRAVVILLKTSNFSDFEKALTAILTVVYSKYTENCVSNKPFQYYVSLLRTMQTGVQLPKIYSDEIFADMSTIEEPGGYENRIKKKAKKDIRPIKLFLEELKSKCSISQVGTTINDYYNPDFGDRLINLCNYFILWTAIIPKLFYEGKIEDLDTICTASSSINEEYFKDLKKYVLNNKKNQRIDGFLTMHLESLSGTTKLLGATVNSEKSQTKNESYIAKSVSSSSTLDNKFDMSHFCTTQYEDSIIEKYDDELSDDVKNKTPKFCSTRIQEDSRSFSLCNLSHDRKSISSYNLKNNSTNLIITNTNNHCKENIIKNENLISTKNSIELDVLSNDSYTKDEAESSKPTKVLQPRNCNIINTSDKSLNNYSHLNYKDEWGGHLKDKKKRGYYLEPQTNIENVLQKPKCVDLPLIINGNSSGPVLTSKGMITVRNTCPIDSTIHCIRSGYVDYYGYHNYIEKSNSKVYGIVKLISSKGISKEIYIKRAEVILSFKSNVENNILDCNLNISNVIDVLLPDEPSLHVTMTCEYCKTVDNHDITVIAPNLKPLYQKGIAGLQDTLNKYTSEYRKTCNKCKTKKLAVVESRNHIFIDIEALQWDLSAKRLGYHDNNYKKFTLNDIPTEIIICQTTFILVGAIEYMKFTDIGHYRSCIKRISNRWEMHDGLSITSKIKPIPKADLAKNKIIHVLFYVKKNVSE